MLQLSTNKFVNYFISIAKLEFNRLDKILHSLEDILRRKHNVELYKEGVYVYTRIF